MSAGLPASSPPQKNEDAKALKLVLATKKPDGFRSIDLTKHPAYNPTKPVSPSLPGAFSFHEIDFPSSSMIYPGLPPYINVKKDHCCTIELDVGITSFSFCSQYWDSKVSRVPAPVSLVVTDGDCATTLAHNTEGGWVNLRLSTGGEFSRIVIVGLPNAEAKRHGDLYLSEFATNLTQQQADRSTGCVTATKLF